MVGWLCWGLTSQSTIFPSCRDGAIASWVINQYFRGVKCLAQGHNTAAVGLEPRTSRSGVRHSTTEPPRSPQKQWVIKIIIYAYLCLFSASKVIMSYGKLITRFTTDGHDIFITCPTKSIHLQLFGLSLYAFCGTGDENIIPTCHSVGSYNFLDN